MLDLTLLGLTVTFKNGGNSGVLLILGYLVADCNTGLRLLTLTRHYNMYLLV